MYVKVTHYVIQTPRGPFFHFCKRIFSIKCLSLLICTVFEVCYEIKFSTSVSFAFANSVGTCRRHFRPRSNTLALALARLANQTKPHPAHVTRASHM